jgi:hypothetical protein
MSAKRLTSLENPSKSVVDRLMSETATVVRDYRQAAPPPATPARNLEEEQLGWAVLETMKQLRTMGCLTCRIGRAVDMVAEANKRQRFDWAGVEARKTGHSCTFTTWDK